MSEAPWPDLIERLKAFDKEGSYCESVKDLVDDPEYHDPELCTCKEVALMRDILAAVTPKGQSDGS